jgi:ABC-2 type transport system ATP-binding protein
MSRAIELTDLRKIFRVRERDPGMRGALRGLFAATTREIAAVEGVSFTIEEGERVAFVGPNGAGKSTTLKVLSGILYPTSGQVRVLGRTPWRHRRELGFRIGTVFGQRTQLWYHLPAADTFDLLARIYEIEPSRYRERRSDLVEAFAIGPLLRKPVRQLSLGERMRCELVASLLHAPSILFLDEPTIGLDVTAKATIRDLIRDHSERDGSTVLLTSHDTGDMERVCDRVLVIHRGRLLLDEPIEALRKRFIRRKRVTVVTAEADLTLEMPGVRVECSRPHRTLLEVDVDQTPVDAVVDAVMRRSRIRDLTVEDPPMEEIVQEIYARADSAAGARP